MRMKDRNPIGTKINIYVGSSLATGRTLIRLRYSLCGIEIARIIRKIGLLPDALCFIPIDSRNSCLSSNRTFNFNAKTKNNILVQFIDVSIGRYNFAGTCHVL